MGKTLSPSIETLFRQTQTALDQDNWDWINLTWLGVLEDPIQCQNLSSSDRQILSQVALAGLMVDDFRVRWQVAKWLPKLEQEALTLLLDLVQSPQTETELLWFALKLLADWDSPQVVLTLADFLHRTTDEDLRAIAAQSLGQLGVAAIPPLAGLLEAEATRLTATQALAQIRDPQVIAPLSRLVNDNNPQIRAIAVEILGQFAEISLYPILQRALLDLNAQVRKEAVIALGLRSELGNDRLKDLKPLLFDLNLEVCQQTAIALSRIPIPKTVQILAQVLESPLTPQPLQITVIQSLGWLELEESVSYLHRSLSLYTQNQEICREIIRVLGHYRRSTVRSEALQCLLTVWESAHPVLEFPLVRQTLAQSLGQFSQANPVLQCLSHDPVDSVRLQAIASLKKIEKGVNNSDRE